MKKTQFILSLDATFVDNLVRGRRGFIPAADIQYGGLPLSLAQNFSDWLQDEFSNNACFAQRDRLEHDKTQRHVIPYVVTQDPTGATYLYSRTAHGGEAGLHGAMSIGLGGHVDISSMDVRDYAREPGASTPCMEGTLKDNIRTELGEEVGLTLSEDTFIRFLGFIVEDGPVNSTHIAFVYQVVTLDPQLFTRTTEQDVYYVGNPKLTLDLIDKYPGLEDWSKRVIEYLATEPASPAYGND